MKSKNFIKIIITYCVFAFLLYWPNSEIIAQIRHPFKLDYAGTTLIGNIDIEVKIIDKDPASKNRPLPFSNERIKANVSKYKNPVLTVVFSNLNFEAPKNLAKTLSLNINLPSIPKGFKQNMRMMSGPMSVNEKRSFTYEIEPSDTILIGELKFLFSSVTMGKRNFRIANNTFQLFLNINPPPLFPPDATENELWKIASKQNSVKAYKVYMERFPKGKSVPEAKRKQRYLIANPDINVVPNDIKSNTTIILKNENEVWRKAKSAKSIDAYNDYIKSFPKGDHVAEAQSVVNSLSASLDTLILKSTEEELLGRLIYHIPDTMTIGQTYRVRLEISADTSSHFIEKLIANVEEFSEHPEELNSEIIQIGKTMHALLEESNPEGERNFYIHLFGESNEREVNLYSSKSTIWEWDVKPLKAGLYPLYFTIEIITIKDGLAKPEVLPVYDSKITILSRSIFQTYKIQFISGGIISVLLVVILFLFFKKKKEVAENKDLDHLIKTNPLEGATALIENDQVKEALNLLDHYLKNKDSELLQEVILLKSRFASNDNSLYKAIISKETALTEQNNIKLATLDIIERSKAYS